LHECLHDRAESPLVPATVSIKSTPRVPTLEDEEDDYHMVSVTAIPPGAEVFNTYGETLTNAQLLTQYGFILEANENDILTWDVEQVLDLITVHDVPRVLFSWKRLCEEDWTSVSRSSFLYLVDAEASRSHSLALNGDGKISHPLWIIVALFSLDQTNNAFSEEASEPMLSHLRSLLDTQCCIERHLETEGADGQTDGCSYDLAVLKQLEQVCQLIIRLCTDRESKTGVVGFPATVSDVGEYFDVCWFLFCDMSELTRTPCQALPDSRPRTKLALSVVLSELSVLNKCEATWSEMLGMVTEYLSGDFVLN
jgi:SET domain-containing protein 6